MVIKFLLLALLVSRWTLAVGQEISELDRYRQLTEHCSPWWAFKKTLSPAQLSQYIAEAVPDYDEAQAASDPIYATHVFAKVHFLHPDIPSLQIMQQSSKCLKQEAALVTLLPTIRGFQTLKEKLIFSTDRALDHLNQALRNSNRRGFTQDAYSSIGTIAFDGARIRDLLAVYREQLKTTLRVFARYRHSVSYGEHRRSGLHLLLEETNWLPETEEAAKFIGPWLESYEERHELFLRRNALEAWDAWISRWNYASSPEQVELFRVLQNDLTDLKRQLARWNGPLFGISPQSQAIQYADWIDEHTSLNNLILDIQYSTNIKQRAYSIGKLFAQYRYLYDFEPRFKFYPKGLPGLSEYEENADGLFEKMRLSLARLEDPEFRKDLKSPKKYLNYVGELAHLTDEYTITRINYHQWANRRIHDLDMEAFFFKNEEALRQQTATWWNEFLRIIHRENDLEE